MSDLGIGLVHSFRHAALAMLLCALSWGQGEPCPQGGSVGRWSVEAVDLCAKQGVVEFTRNYRIYSPDRHAAVHVSNFEWRLEAEANVVPQDSGPGPLTYPAELAWAPDSQSFYITQSEGNITGFRTVVFKISGVHLQHMSDINQVVMRDFEKHHKCIFKQNGQNIGGRPNVAGLSWQSGSARLLVIAEVPPHGLCEEGGYFEGYVLSLPEGRIVERFGPDAVVQRWGKAMGVRLRGDWETVKERNQGR